jgi:hypothetical protein
VKILLDPTNSTNMLLQINNQKQKIPHTRDSGIGLIKALTKLKISAKDELWVIVGPGRFAAIRTAALVANAIAYLSGCKLFAKKLNEKKFRQVKNLQPFYEKN